MKDYREDTPLVDQYKHMGWVVIPVGLSMLLCVLIGVGALLVQ